jgi:ubiquinone/menaquinone biosynthesis C-methylase UbiE
MAERSKHFRTDMKFIVGDVTDMK